MCFLLYPFLLSSWSALCYKSESDEKSRQAGRRLCVGLRKASFPLLPEVICFLWDGGKQGSMLIPCQHPNCSLKRTIPCIEAYPACFQDWFKTPVAADAFNAHCLREQTSLPPRQPLLSICETVEASFLTCDPFSCIVVAFFQDYFFPFWSSCIYILK